MRTDAEITTFKTTLTRKALAISLKVETALTNAERVALAQEYIRILDQLAILEWFGVGSDNNYHDMMGEL